MYHMRAALTMLASETDIPELKDAAIGHSRFCGLRQKASRCIDKQNVCLCFQTSAIEVASRSQPDADHGLLPARS